MNIVVRKDADGAMQVAREPIPEMPPRTEADHRGDEMSMTQATFQDLARRRERRQVRDYTTEVSEGMVVLDAVHQIQAKQANDLACRWNCKAGKCGSCSAEINGMPRLCA